MLTSHIATEYVKRCERIGMSAAVIGANELPEGTCVEHLGKPAVVEALFVQGSHERPVCTERRRFCRAWAHAPRWG